MLGPPVRREPACGAAFQPHGPVELGFVNSLIAELALDALLSDATGGTHRIWIGPRKRLVQIGGCWSSVWRDEESFREEGGFIFERRWPVAVDIGGMKAQAA
jgi:sulfur-carrier protein adenylyltransferase/sulfurtransferase